MVSLPNSSRLRGVWVDPAARSLVMATACQQLSVWSGRPETSHLTVAVNVSAKQFHLPTFVEEV